jgi:hypothetical protein
MEETEIIGLYPGFLDALDRHQLESTRHPIPDFRTPDDPDRRFGLFGEEVRLRVDHGHILLAYCNAGLGRTAIFLAAILKGCGFPWDAIEEIRCIHEPDAMRGPNQKAFVRGPVFGGTDGRDATQRSDGARFTGSSAPTWRRGPGAAAISRPEERR